MNVRVRRTVGVGIACLMLALAWVPLGAVGHAHVAVPPYEFIVGWRVEPPFAGVLNGLDLGIERHTGNTTEWVTGAEGNLTATLVTGSSSVIKPLEPQFGQPGWYTFDVIPTRTGPYSIIIQGNLGGTAVDFTQDLEQVAASGDVQFPATDPTTLELKQSLDEQIAETQALRSQTTVALAIGVAGLLVGLASIGIGVRARSKNTPKP